MGETIYFAGDPGHTLTVDLYRNFVLHDKKRGYLHLKESDQQLLKIETLMDRNPSEVPAEIKFLLEYNIDGLCCSSIDTQQCWVWWLQQKLQ